MKIIKRFVKMVLCKFDCGTSNPVTSKRCSGCGNKL